MTSIPEQGAPDAPSFRLYGIMIYVTFALMEWLIVVLPMFKMYPKSQIPYIPILFSFGPTWWIMTNPQASQIMSEFKVFAALFLLTQSLVIYAGLQYVRK